MFSTVLSATLRGLFVEFVQVEADTSNGLPVFHMVGYLSSEVKEAGERVRTAIKNSGISLPAKKIVVNLSPAALRKTGSMFDLPIAIAVLASLGEVEEMRVRNLLFVGELSLDGGVKRVPGVLPIVLEAKKRGVRICVVPRENQKEGALVEGIRIIGVTSLLEVCQILKGEKERESVESSINAANLGDDYVEKLRDNLESDGARGKDQVDYRDIHGQRLAKRAAEIAVAGNHNLLMIGPPGTGKTMIAKRLPTILPPLTKEESMDLTMIYSVIGGLDKDAPLITSRPFREVHQTVTGPALMGGGMIPKPGEITLAHKGVLFLDEIAEFQKPVLELLRQPLEDHQMKIVRERGEYLFPAEFLLVAAMNPCPCGNYPDLNRCKCTGPQIQNYLGRLSSPLLDRIDICVEVERIQYQDLKAAKEEESSAEIRERVVKARDMQKERYKNLGILTNSQLSARDAKVYCSLKEKEDKMMRQAFERMHLTARMYYKVLTVARTIADLDGSEHISSLHLSEALSYRFMDRKYWGGDL